MRPQLGSKNTGQLQSSKGKTMRLILLGAPGAGKGTPVSYTHLTQPTNREV